MFRFLPYILKSLWGHRARTLLTISGAAVAMFVFCFISAVQEGMHRLTADEESQRSLIVFQENRFCPTSSRLPEDYASQIRKIPGVAEVIPIQVWTNNCRASLDIIVFNGVAPQQLREHRRLALQSGSWEEFSSPRYSNAALVGRSVAQRRGLKPGQPFRVGDDKLTVHVAGIFTSPIPAEENLVYTKLQFLQYARGLDSAGVVTQHEVRLTPDADPDEVAAAIDAALSAGPVATTTRRRGAFQTSTLSDLVDIIGFAHWLGFACVGLVFALVGTTTLMSVQDRMAEYGVLQTLGLRPARVFRLVMSECLILCLLGGLAGTALATSLLAWGGFAVGAEGVTIAFRPSWTLFLQAVTVSLGVGVLAGVMPAWQAAKTPVVAALNHAV